MYNTKHECRYYRDDIFLETDNLNDDEKDFVRNALYRDDFMKIFYIQEDDNDEKDFAVVSELYNKISNCKELKECMKIAASTFISEDEIVGLCILFSYDFMYLTHKCIISYLENGETDPNCIKSLKDVLH
jgi:hypothetical protein